MSDPSYYPESHGTPYKPGGDWGNFYGHGNSGKPALYAPVHRLGVLPAYREEPLQEPYILWDSRTIAKGDTRLVNGGTAGETFDLKLGGSWEQGEPTGQALPYTWMHAYKTMNWDNSFGTTTDPPGGFPSNVSQMGGGTCDGAYTLMVAISPRFYRRETLEAELAATGATDYDGYRYIEVDWLSNADAGDGGGPAIDQNFLGDNDDSQADTGLFHEWYDFANYCIWLQGAPSATYEPHPSGGLPFSGRLLTFVADPWEGRYYVYIDTELVKFYDVNADYEPPGTESIQQNFIDWAVNCLQQDDGQTDVENFHETFLYFYGHEMGVGSRYEDHTAWNSVIGAAFFRGMPTTTQIEEWKEYFLPAAGQGYQAHGLGLEVTRTGLTRTDPHAFDWVVPDNNDDPESGSYPIDEIVLQMSHARGGQHLQSVSDVYAKFGVEPGDTIRIELGGSGATPRTDGFGGWPDGGNGGLSATSGLRGGGGGGSTRIYRNGVLYIVMPGSGGGAQNTTGGGAPNVTDSSGMRISAPDFEGFDAPNPPPGSVSLQAFKGKGATTLAPGAGGTGGGSSGVGSLGGNGTTTSASAAHTGGGGGGGGYFGGGGGGAGGGSTVGGGAGSWFKHANVTLMDNNPTSPTGGPVTTGVDAQVTIYYW